MRHLLVILTLWSAHVAILFSAAVGFHRNLDNLVDNSFDTTSSKAAGFRHHFRRDGEKPLLRIMPLGASITQGFDAGLAETLQCGYRKPLRDELRYRGYEVNMVGSRVHGNFSDLQHEGWPGYEIEGVASKMLTVMTTQKPNLVLMLLGSNDCFHAKRDGNLGYARSAKDRMNAMLEKIYDLSPGVTVILATLPPTTDPANEPYIQAANAGYRELVSDLQGKSRNIELAEMYTDWFEPGDRSDSIHFNDAGYAKMAAIFADAFNRVENKNWLAEPIDTGVPDNRNGKFIHVGDWDGNGLCDILAVDSATGDADMFRNTYKAGEPNPTFEPPVRIVSGSLCPQPITTSNPFDLAVRFGDLDGDGRVDYICMSPDGRSLAWLNTPSGLHTLPSTMPNQIKLSEGYDRSEHRWADVNGDGKVDFLAINKFSGEVQVWINLGTTPTLTSGMTWDRQRDIWMAGAERGANVHFPRLSRSKRADYHVAYPQTNVAETWFNEGRCVGARDDGEVRDPGLPRVEM
ncbi:SGNH hydrolase [Ophiobolus disseminans]|uniref:SGNH hydrolase n=1 Tax=Ophiobolus disseminans TaxID=1469910 RepID=A0A6A7A9N9_9PLEO|nr:SGNH hydrolase [Ophiobolus disseminans]